MLGTVGTDQRREYTAIGTRQLIGASTGVELLPKTRIRGVSEAIFRFVGGDVVFRMRIDEFEPGRRVAWTCVGDYDEWNGTTLSWDLEPTEDGGAVLNFAHRGWATTEKEYPECNASWGNLLHMVKDHLEGRPIDVHPSGRAQT